MKTMKAMKAMKSMKAVKSVKSVSRRLGSGMMKIAGGIPDESAHKY